MAATLAEGTTILENAAQEPEIEDLCHFLNKAGARISGINTSTIIIEGVRNLQGISYSIIPDRVEVGTLLITAGMTKGEVEVKNVNVPHLSSVLDKMAECGLKIVQKPNSVLVSYQGQLNAIEVTTEPFPGFPTDMQAQMMSLLTLAKGKSVIKETIFENRFMHAHELNRMGARISLDNQMAVIDGVDQLSSAEVKITDLRAGAALVLAGLAAGGQTKVYGLKHLNRGYDNLQSKLTSIGGVIKNDYSV